VPDFSRFDLNGDGFTGGLRVAPMQLDPGDLPLTAAPEFGALVALVENDEEVFNQAGVTDLQALCFLAYRTGPQLYTGSTVRREELLGAERCSRPITLSTIFPQAFSGDADLDVLVTLRVTGPAGSTVQEPLADLLVRFSPNCASVSAAERSTDQAGRANVRVTPAQGCNSVSVRVDVLDNGALIASEIVTATVSTGATLNVIGNYRGTFTCTVQNDLDIFNERVRNCNSIQPGGDEILVGFGRDEFLCQEFDICNEPSYTVQTRQRDLSCNDPVIAFPRFTDTFTENQAQVTFSVTRTLQGFTTAGFNRVDSMTGVIDRPEEPVLITLNIEAEETSSSGFPVARFSCLFTGEKVR